MSRSAQLRAASAAFAFITLLTLAGCAPTRDAALSSSPRLHILGTAQDGGLPHAACTCPNCTRARRDPAARRFISSLALILPLSNNSPNVYIIDATPDIRDQLDLLRDLHPGAPARVNRAPIDGLFLTHAHIGHYLGLAFFGFEAVNSADLPTYGTPRMAAFLRANGPWSQLVTQHNIALRELPPGQPVNLAFNDGRDTIELTPIQVPHRDEYSDTVAYLIRRNPPANSPPSTHMHTTLYLPDTEPWPKWQTPLPDLLAQYHVDTLLLDGTFYSPDELPGRAVASIGHPLMTDSMTLLEPLVGAGRLRVYFTHLNHSNPAIDPASPAARDIQSRGFQIAREKMELPL